MALFRLSPCSCTPPKLIFKEGDTIANKLISIHAMLAVYPMGVQLLCEDETDPPSVTMSRLYLREKGVDK